jgi:L-amino acid N-acyltransferase YncA
MKIVDAFWEQRNLGVTSTEVTVEENDCVAEMVTLLRTLDRQYQVVKVPAGRYDLMETVAQAGFSFIEASLNVVHNLKVAEPAGIMKRINDSITYEEMNAGDVEKLYAEIRKGVFITDRIYLDPAFSSELAAQRYIYWVQDEVERGGQLYKLVYKREAVGFFIFKETTGGGCYPFLSGLYAAAATPGLGNVLLHKIIEEAVRRGLKFISSYISTNNLPVVKVHISEGFTIINIYYVYVRHV